MCRAVEDLGTVDDQVLIAVKVALRLHRHARILRIFESLLSLK